MKVNPDKPTEAMISATKKLKGDHKKLEKKTQDYYSGKMKRQKALKDGRGKQR